MRFLVIGAAGYAQEVAWSLREQRRVRAETSEFTFFNDGIVPGPLPSGLGHVVGGLDLVGEHVGDGEVRLVLGVDLPRAKAAVVARLAALELNWETVIHPAAVIGPNVSLGEGGYVGAGAILTVNLRVGAFAAINTHCHVGPDDVLGDFVTLHPGVHLSGEVTIAEGCELGTGAVVAPSVTLGPWSVLGAGAVAVTTLPGGETYVGLPARPLAVIASDRTPADPETDGRISTGSAAPKSTGAGPKGHASRRFARQ